MNGTSEQVQRKVGWERQICAELGSVVLDRFGLPLAIGWNVRQLPNGTGVLYELTVSDSAAVDLPEGRATTLFDVYAEALGKVARHAGAGRVVVALTMTPQEATLVVRDDGVAPGGEGAAAANSGMATIRARSSRQKGLGEAAAASDAGNDAPLGLQMASAL